MAITLRVRDLMEKNVVTIGSDSTVAEAIKKMLSSNVWSLVVLIRGLPEGVVTERDLIRRCFAKGLVPERLTVEKIMSSPLITIGPDATIREAMSLMVEKDIRRLFVVEEGKIVGRLTQGHLLESTLDMMSSLSSLTGPL
ncbi:MAG TPA: CBS domain-containing protein [Nitrososphaerales archaeon]|nr:CBS domain-containing protein [Nitrososphaerales archaeon]